MPNPENTLPLTFSEQQMYMIIIIIIIIVIIILGKDLEFRCRVLGGGDHHGNKVALTS